MKLSISSIFSIPIASEPAQSKGEIMWFGRLSSEQTQFGLFPQSANDPD
jgi:hypothetical protein